LRHFDHALTHDSITQIPFIKRVIAATNGTIKIFASPWSPPAWMKGNKAMIGSSEPGLRPEPQYHRAWAVYISNWIQAYRKHGVNLWYTFHSSHNIS
jgi:glucosylceramidase